MRRITKRVLLYTEMISIGAILYGDRAALLDFDADEHPLALQIGGADPHQCAEALRIASDWNYDEYNLNVGCPSSRVQHAIIGACLMAQPDHVARIVEAMKRVCDRPVTVKHRIGIEGYEDYEHMRDFVHTVTQAGADRCIVHARIAILNGLSPKQNRTVPPLRYDDVYRLKAEYPELTIEINGGIRGYDAIDTHLQHTDGVMIGRAAYDNPWLFSQVDRRYYGECGIPTTPRQVIEAMIEYLEWGESLQGTRVADASPLGRGAQFRPYGVLRHMLGLFHARPAGRRWRRLISNASSSDAGTPLSGAAVLRRAMREMPAESLNASAERDTCVA